MPLDIRSNVGETKILVTDRIGVSLPFSRGIMATSILATGMETPLAYKIAEEIQNSLVTFCNREISSTQLTDLAISCINKFASHEDADRYRLWRKAKRIGRPFVISLVAAGGVGKSTLATRLALRLGINRVVTTDSIREVLRTVIPESVLPELHVSTYETLSSSSPTNDALSIFLRQSHAVGAASAAVAKRYVTENKSLILEGVHLLPGILTKELKDLANAPVVVEVLITLLDENQHKSRLLHRRASEPLRNGSRHLDNFNAIRILQTELRKMAHVAGIPEYDVSESTDLTQRIVKQVIESTVQTK